MSPWVQAVIAIAAAIGAWDIYYRIRRTRPVLVAAIAISICALGWAVITIVD